MVSVIGVRFQQNGKMYYFDADTFNPVMGDYVIVNTSRGIDLGEVVMGTHPVEDDRFKTPLEKMVRAATEQDIQRATDNRKREADAFVICQKKIAEHKLEMKLVSVECAFDNSKILFYFTANGRVDFRSLVKDLASVFKTRIELRQIGVRDEARMLGGLGPCGRPICCGTFLSDFQPVSIKMAKEQSLSLNPTKISGVCGRLMCCLKYEQDHYEQTRKKMPRVGREVMTPDGPGIVSELNIVRETVSVRINKGDESEVKTFAMDQIVRPGAAGNDGKPGPAEQDEALPPQEDEDLLTGEIPEEPEADAEEGEAPAREGGRDRNQDRRRSRNNHPRDPQRAKGPRKDRPDGKPEAPAGEGEGKEFRGRDRKNREKKPGDRDQKEGASPEKKLGQPVRRENRARNRAEAPEAGGENAKTGQNASAPAPAAQNANATASAPARPEGAAPQAGKKRGGWANAVEKAIRAADEQE